MGTTPQASQAAPSERDRADPSTLRLSVGYSLRPGPWGSPLAFIKQLSMLAEHRAFIHDVHFAHFNPMICASGREPAFNFFGFTREMQAFQYAMIEWNATHTELPLALLLNYLLHDNYQVVVKDFAANFYPRGIRRVVVADLNLIKALRDRFPDLQIQGSCLSYRMTEQELAEEAKEGVSLHNPAVDIIRNSAQLKRNALAGYKQKIIFSEGCLHRCPEERKRFGHRWYAARGLSMGTVPCTERVSKDFRLFLKANWITLDRLKELLPYIHVVKLPRGCFVGGHPGESLAATFLRLFESAETYNVLDTLGIPYTGSVARRFPYIPSSCFGREFFETVEACDMDCEQRGCSLCFEIEDRLERLCAKRGEPQ